MYYIYIIAALVLLVLAAKKRRRRRSGRFVALPFNTQQALATLADETVVSADLTTNLAEDFYAISVDIIASIDGGASEGPVEVGVAHDDYTVAEIKEFIDVNLTDPDDKIAQERSRRLIRRLGTIANIGAGGASLVPRSGEAKRIPLRFVLGDGHTLSAWVMNHSGGALTTGAVITFSGTLYGRWLR